MSSLAATQADGYYIPPSYHDSGAYKKKSVSQHNQPGFKGHNQFLQRNVCRFELPFDGFCTKCQNIVGKGTRFNAHKAHVDDYFTTKIYEFTTNCRACQECEFKIRTNPKERTFDYVSGIRKKVEEFDSAEAGTRGVIDTDFGNGILEYKNGKLDAPDDADGNLHRLESHVAGHRKAQTEHEHMESLIGLNAKLLEDADANASIRATFRKDRKAKKRRLGEAAGLGLGKGIELAEGRAEDAALAQRAMRSREGGRALQSEKDRFRSVRAGGIFGAKGSPTKKKKSSGGRRAGESDAAASSGQGKARGSGAADDATKPMPKRKIPICTQPLGGQPKVAVTSPPSPDQGALAALSGFYASDSE
ncbi:hypothetical protein ACHAXT_011924 [Thalassiosira profunda]